MALLNDTVKRTDYTLHAEKINDNVITNYVSVYSLLVYSDTVTDIFPSLYWSTVSLGQQNCELLWSCKCDQTDPIRVSANTLFFYKEWKVC
jgi:hypothetical protein